ncbi:xanthotoxin 5-hydroxylase CYP82C4-like [Punica granatum]|uniref:Uncharacterized protein n=2 Tax=Punica granatum TaxID=22663 RepID=A0A218VRE0_PUNGR|nr:xanthotoxin 5-hydroxylase CYP82C4-like [Punica granatum]OWM62768.1 hypothetical protein CDL15_Pgr020062 [Punica granatum]PKI76752.1 hypothetical protein CRG98_002738 [Punica granatum]
MEDPILPRLLALASLVALLLVLWRSRSRTRSNDEFNLPPEVPGAWPIIGHLHQLRDQVPLARTLASMSDRYGPVFLIRLGVHPAVVISTHESVRECFTTHDRALASRPRSKAGIHLGYNYAAFGFARYGPYWREMRKLTMLELLGPRRLEALRHVQVSEINTLIKGLYDTVITTSDGRDRPIAIGEKKPVIISQWLEHMTLNVITEMIAGKRYFGSQDRGLTVEGEAAHVRRVIKEFMHISGFPAISDLIPYTGWTDFVGTVRSMKRIARELDAIVGSWVEEHEQRRVIDGDRRRKEDLDFIDVMLSVIEDNSLLGFSRETIIKATIVNIIVAGSDTTSLNLTWIVSLLLNHKHVLDKAQEELDLRVGRDRWVRDSDIENLPYLQAIIKETLRLYPPGPLSVPHEGEEDCTVNGYQIPKGTRIFVNVWKLHRDPRVWSHPQTFLPERFLSAGHAKGIDASGQHFEFIPFGSGRRVCPGAAFALQVTHLTLARLLQGFDMATPGNAPVDMTEGLAVTLPKANPVEVILTPRLPAKLFEELTGISN